MKQKPKRGHVVRLSDFAYDVVSANKTGSLRETIDSMIANWAELVARVEDMERVRPLFVLKSDVHRTLKEAKGAAVLRAVRAKTEKIDEVVRVRGVE